MLVNSKEMLEKAKQEKYAVAQFNINNLEWTRYILEECEILKVPVILGVSEGAARYMGGYYTVFNIVEALLEDLHITIPVCLHLDHGSSVESCKKAIDSGFTSVMIDASRFSLEENIKVTQDVCLYAKNKNVTVEAEIGHIGGEEDDIKSHVFHAKLNECKKFYEETKIDSLAPALGSVHGLYKGEANLDFVTMKELDEALPIPLVLHGGTGIEKEKIEKAISCGITKININTELQVAWATAVRKYLKNNEVVYDPRKVISSGEQAIKEVIRKKIAIFKTRL